MKKETLKGSERSFTEEWRIPVATLVRGRHVALVIFAEVSRARRRAIRFREMPTRDGRNGRPGVGGRYRGRIVNRREITLLVARVIVGVAVVKFNARSSGLARRDWVPRDVAAAKNANREERGRREPEVDGDGER